MLPHPNFKKILLVLIFLFSTIAIALPEDSSKNMYIVADSTLFNYKTGFNTYSGNVNVTQGESRLNADRVTTQSNHHHKIEEAIAYGTTQPAHYWTLPKVGELLFHARADIIKFYPQKALVFLEGNVFVTKGNNSFNGAQIIYNLKNQTIISPANKKSRATIVIDAAKSTS